MSKKRRQKQPSLFPELNEIVAALHTDAQQDLLILVIPSHDDQQNELPNQDQWASAGLELIGDVFGGATAFKAIAGVYKADDGRLLYDVPILIESYVKRPDLEDHSNLMVLLRFCKRMGRETRQDAVGLVINNVFHIITDFSDQ